MGTGYSTGLSIEFVYLLACITAIDKLSLPGEAATVQVAGPRPTPSGIDIDEAVEEARRLIPDITPGGEGIGYLRSTGGLLRIYKDWNGQLYIVGHDGAPSLLAAAEKIAAALGILVGG